MSDQIVDLNTENQQEDVDAIIRRNNYKLTAYKIKQILSKVLNDPSKSYRRWIWELMQNAKDVPNKAFQRVSIQIVLTEDKLLFKHNGDPFLVNNITGLIQQVSSKISDGSDDEVTGKFGTGFISTHLLSEVIDVAGVVKHKGLHRHFKVKLDRGGNSSEELLPKIESELEKIRKIEDSSLFPVIEDYDSTRQENSYDTIFTYYLTSPEKQKAARAGVEDLINTLPFTLVNIPKIKRVEVINQLDQSTNYYDCQLLEEIDPVRKVKVVIDGNIEKKERSFIVYSVPKELSLVAEVNNYEELALINHAGEQPNLYRDFPLIGSEKFYFPFALNGFHFFPTEDRDGVFLNSVESAEAQLNREIIEKAIGSSVKFTEWLVSAGTKNRYVCALSRKPDYKWEEFSEEWFEELQTSWRASLTAIELVETEGGDVIPLNNAVIPNYGSKNETKLYFHELVTPFFGKDRVPASSIALNWVAATGPKTELDSWGKDLQYDLLMFLKELESVKTLSSLAAKLELRESEVINWLNKVYAFLGTEKETDHLREVYLVPNAYGEFKSIDDLWIEDSENLIPDYFLDILRDLGVDWRKDLIKRGIDLAGLNVKSLALKDVSDKINEILKEDTAVSYNQKESVFLKRPGALEILVRVLSVKEPATEAGGFRFKLLSKAQDLLKVEVMVTDVDGSAAFSYSQSQRLLVQLLNNHISDNKDVTKLAEELEISVDDAVAWLNDYLLVLESKTGYSDYLKEGNIIPNRYGQLRAYEDISNFGTQETPLDDELIEILQKLAGSKDWKKDLVIDGITLHLPNTIKFEELGLEIDSEIKRIQAEEANENGVLDSYREAFLELIEWCGANERLADNYLKHFQANSSKLFFTLTLGNTRISRDVIKMLKDEESIELLSEISKANLDRGQVKELLEIASSLGSLDKIIQHARELKEVKEDFDFRLQIGTQVEDAFKEALEKAQLNAEIVSRGKGKSDIEIRNPENNRTVLIEVKSYLSDSNLPFRFAASQAREAVENSANYFICTVPRPSRVEDVTAEYIKIHSGYKKDLTEMFKPGLRDLSTLEEIQSSREESTLHMVFMEEIRISVERSVLKAGAGSFEQLIEEIKGKLG